MVFIASEMENRVAEHHIHEIIRKGHLLDVADLNVLRRQPGRERRREPAHMIDRLGVRVESKDLAAFAEQMDEIANSPMQSNRSAAVTMPGLVIQIINQPGTQSQPVRVIDANPLIDNDRDILSENVER